MTLNKGEQHEFVSKRFGKVTIENVGRDQLNVRFHEGKFEEKGYISLSDGEVRNVPQELLIEIMNQ